MASIDRLISNLEELVTVLEENDTKGENADTIELIVEVIESLSVFS